MDATENIGDNNQTEDATQSSNGCRTTTETTLNGDAAPFIPTESGDSAKHTYGTFTLKIPVDSKIWKDIAAYSPPSRCFETRKQSPPRETLPYNVNLFPDPRFRSSLSAEVLPDGLISVRRKDDICVDISLDRSIRIACPQQKMMVCISGSTMNTVVFHPNGRICQNNLRVDLVAFDGSHQNNLLRYAKFWQKGISFMAKDVPVAYLVDEAGLRSSIDHFISIKKDYAFDIFNKDCRNMQHTSYPLNEAITLVQRAHHTHTLDGSEVIDVNQVRVTNNSDGTICVERPNKSCCVRVNPRKVAITLTTSHIHATASMGKSPHLFLRQGDRRIHFDGAVFCARNGGYSAGFDEKNRVTIFNKKLSPLDV